MPYISFLIDVTRKNKMKRAAHGNPVFISNENLEILESVNPFLEGEIQDLIFKHPECLPISDIDESYNPVIPVCKELRTNAGPFDIFMVTPNGDLVIVETKLWSNPEARRKVVAQILDYAKEISNWSYSDLQRELNKKLGTKGNILYQYSLKTNEENHLNEIYFVDAVSRNLRLGKLMLVIAGDGIREGAKNLTEFISKAGHLNFSLAMIELPIFKNSRNELVVFPRTIVKTVEIQKINIEVSQGITIQTDSSSPEDVDIGISPELEEKREYFTDFWGEFLNQLDLDDPECSIPPITKSWNLASYPGLDKNSKISAYFSKSSGRVGVYFKFRNNQQGLSLKEKLSDFKDDIKLELDEQVNWDWHDSLVDGFSIRKPFDDVYHPKNRKEIIEFFSYWINNFINIMRPKLKEIV